MAQTANRDAQQSPYLQRSLYVFDLPEELLYTLELRAELNQVLEVSETERESQDSPDSPSPSVTADDSPAPSANTTDNAKTTWATSCALCNLNFSTVQDQRSHVRSDLHGYNLKQKLRGQKAVNEGEFDKLVGDLDESLSGSDDDSTDMSSDEEEGEDGKKGDTTLSALLRKQAHIADPEFDHHVTVGKKQKVGAGKPPMLWFTSPKLPKDTSLGVYRAIFTPEEQLLDSKGLVEVLQKKQLSSTTQSSAQQSQKPVAASSASSQDDGGVALPPQQPKPSVDVGPHYFLCMIGGGHFAAMLVSLRPKTVRRNGIEDRTATVIANKTFHRYTTRRKQGGSQSANDNSKGNAHSAGAGIRRYNEAALVTDVRTLLSKWKDLIDTSDLIFLRATGSTNRKTLFENYEGRVLDAKDPRIRGFPFSTRRATQSELMRAFIELTRVKTSVVDYEALRQRAMDQQAALAKASADEARRAEKETARKAQLKTLSAADETALLHTTQLQSLIRRSKAPALVSYITSNSLPPDFRFFPPEDPKTHHAPRPLHLASSLNSAACVSALLLKSHADPCVVTGENKTAYELAGDRATRDAFRVARGELGESAWDWESARVGPALTKAEAESRAAAEKAEQAAAAKAEGERRKKEAEKLREEDKRREEGEREKRVGKGRSLGILGEVERGKTAEERRDEEGRGMGVEMRAKLERERRARAAEARLGRK